MPDSNRIIRAANPQPFPLETTAYPAILKEHMNNETPISYTRKVTIGDATLYCGDSLELLRAGVFGKLGAIVSDTPCGIGFQHGGGRRLTP